MFEYIKELKPYFFSLREVENNTVLDIKLPITWKYEEILLPYKSLKYKIQDKNDKFTLISIISVSTSEGYNLSHSCAKEIIKINREEEEKRSLFEQKVTELRLLFQKESLEKLKDITFIDTYGYQNQTSEGVVGEGDEERRDRIEQPQNEDDQPIEIDE
jgi:hypothetical protein